LWQIISESACFYCNKIELFIAHLAITIAWHLIAFLASRQMRTTGVPNATLRQQQQNATRKSQTLNA